MNRFIFGSTKEFFLKPSSTEKNIFILFDENTAEKIFLPLPDFYAYGYICQPKDNGVPFLILRQVIGISNDEMKKLLSVTHDDSKQTYRIQLSHIFSDVSQAEEIDLYKESVPFLFSERITEDDWSPFSD